MPGRLYLDDPLSPEERDEYESDLIAFCDRELDLLGDIDGRDVLYAGGTSPLWIEGLAERIGEDGSLTILDLDEEGLREAEAAFASGDLPLRPRFVAGDVFDLPFERGDFHLAYSSGLFHELDARGGGVIEALGELARVVYPGGGVATSDFVSDTPSVQLEEEAIEAEVSRLSSGAELHGIHGSELVISAHEEVLGAVGHRVMEPFRIRHLDKLTLSREAPPGIEMLVGEDLERARHRWRNFLQRVREEGYTRPATVFIEGMRS